MTIKKTEKNKQTVFRTYRNYADLEIEEYENIHWPAIQSAVKFLLSQPDGNCSELSYERIYGSVYTCVCRHYAEQLFHDLSSEVKSYFDIVTAELSETSEEELINVFDHVLGRFHLTLDGIIPLFSCLNRYYLGSKLETDLKTELLRIFVSNVSEVIFIGLVGALRKAQDTPFATNPATMARVVKGLYNLKKEYADLAPDVFARFIPNVLPPMQLSDLPNFVAETQQYQEHLRSAGFVSGDQSRKRAGEDTVHLFHPSEY